MLTCPVWAGRKTYEASGLVVCVMQRNKWKPLPSNVFIQRAEAATEADNGADNHFCSVMSHVACVKEVSHNSGNAAELELETEVPVEQYCSSELSPHSFAPLQCHMFGMHFPFVHLYPSHRSGGTRSATHRIITDHATKQLHGSSPYFCQKPM